MPWKEERGGGEQGAEFELLKVGKASSGKADDEETGKRERGS